jgi:uncharacterized protein (DUF58 family)
VTRTLLALGWHLGGALLLPFVLAVVAGLFLEVSQVADTAPALLALCALVLLPVLAMQLVGISLKARREIALARAVAPLDPEETLEIVLRHARIVTPRGWAVLAAGVFFVLAALTFKFADISFVGVLALLLFYGMVGVASLVSAVFLGNFTGDLQARRGTVARAATPAVITQGEAGEEQFTLRNVPVLPGWNLLIEDELPARLGTVSRYAIGPGARRGEVIVAGRFRRSPRGLYRLGPARIAFADLFGIARVSVASLARTDLKVLPRFVPLRMIDPPRTRKELPDTVTRPHRFPTDDFFRFRAYVAGDDTRRIHWRLSVRVGEVQVRQPETRELSTRTVLLALDTYLPGSVMPDAVGMEEVLDRLVETFLAMARSLAERGDKVVMVAVARALDGSLRPEVLQARRGTHLRWQDLGARVAWQARHDVGDLFAAAGPDMEGVIVSSRMFAPPADLGPGPHTWVYLPPVEALAGEVPTRWQVIRGETGILRDPHPAGADENGFLHQLGVIRERLAVRDARLRLKERAQNDGGAVLTSLVRAGHRVYRLEPTALGHTLVGVA